MLTSRWWYVALAASTIGPAVYLAVLRAPVAYIAAGAAVGAVYALVFLFLRPRACEGNGAAIALSLLTAVFAGVLTALAPLFAILQAFAHPLVWVVAKNRRGAIVGSAVVASAVAAGFVFSIPGEDAWQQILLSQVLSFGFAVIMGSWISRIAELGEEKARLLADLLAAQDELAALHRDAGVTDERARMSREVHDTVAQSLTGLVLLAQRARREQGAGALDAETLELIETGARDALAETRALVAAAAPVELAQGGLPDALRHLAERFERETHISVTVSAQVEAPLERDIEVVLLRCAQEGLANVRKHAQAARARVELSAGDGQARLTVTDDGRGFPPDVGRNGGFGLSGLRDRLALVGGALAVDGAAGSVTLTATVPMGGAA